MLYSGDEIDFYILVWVNEIDEIQEQSLQTVKFEVLPPVDISDTRKLEIYKIIIKK